MNPVQARREALGISAQALSDWSGIRVRALRRIESGPVDGHSRSLEVILEALDELEDNPDLLDRLEGDHERRWMTLP